MAHILLNDVEDAARWKATAFRHFIKAEEDLFQKYNMDYSCECVRRYSYEINDWILTIKDYDTLVDINLFSTSNWRVYKDSMNYYITFNYDGKKKVLIFLLSPFDNKTIWFCGMNEFI